MNLQDFQIISLKNFYDPIDGAKRIIDINYDLFFPMYTGYSFPIKIDDTQFFSKLYDKFLKTSLEIFGEFDIYPDNRYYCWGYRSNKDDSKENLFHNHSETSIINGVYYLEVCDAGISFVKDREIYDYLPENGELLIFPATLDHAPQVNRLPNYRYSVNMEIVTKESIPQLFGRGF